VARAERAQRARELAGHVVGDDHDAESRRPLGWGAHGAER
jgi:hypothetical protein